jgi:large subunit ribosomal protein L17
MRHRKQGRQFSRVRKVRKAFIASLVSALVLKRKIKTTEARAKEIRPVVERAVHKMKNPTLARRRNILRLFSPAVVKRLEELGKEYQERSGGYVRIVKLPRRASDSAKMAMIEFI